jgi:hypothetical protein
MTLNLLLDAIEEQGLHGRGRAVALLDLAWLKKDYDRMYTPEDSLRRTLRYLHKHVEHYRAMDETNKVRT